MSPIARTCNCGPSPMPVIRPGEGIIVTGAGTSTSPMVITAEVTSFASALAAIDTETVNMSVVGSGTTQDPFLISASSRIAMSQLIDWDDPEGPALGDVPVWNGLAWEAAPPPTVPPGSVFAMGGIVGDGNLLDPLRVAVSSTSLDSNTGLAIYVDTDGALRAERPAGVTTAWSSITDKPSSFPSTWADVTGKPTSFPTTWGNVANTPASFPTTWSSVSGKPNVATFRPGIGGNAVTDVTSNNVIGLYWDGGRPIFYVDGTTVPLSRKVDDDYIISLVTALQAGRALAVDDVNQAIYARGTYQAHQREAGSNRYAVWVDGGFIFGRATSSLRYKDHVRPWDVDVDALLDIEPKEFHRKIDDPGVMDYGAIAEHLDEAGLTELVYYDDDGLPDGIQDHRVLWALLAALRSLRERITELEG